MKGLLRLDKDGERPLCLTTARLPCPFPVNMSPWTRCRMSTTAINKIITYIERPFFLGSEREGRTGATSSSWYICLSLLSVADVHLLRHLIKNIFWDVLLFNSPGCPWVLITLREPVLVSWSKWGEICILLVSTKLETSSWIPKRQCEVPIQCTPGDPPRAGILKLPSPSSSALSLQPACPWHPESRSACEHQSWKGCILWEPSFQEIVTKDLLAPEELGTP